MKLQGLVFNPYDRCIANITIEGKQCMISCYVDGNKISQIDEHANTRIIEAISEHFGELTKSNFMGTKIKF